MIRVTSQMCVDCKKTENLKIRVQAVKYELAFYLLIIGVAIVGVVLAVLALLVFFIYVSWTNT